MRTAGENGEHGGARCEVLGLLRKTGSARLSTPAIIVVGKSEGWGKERRKGRVCEREEKQVPVVIREVIG